MIFPRFLKEKDTIGITACSCGILRKIDKYEVALNNFKSEGFNIIETKNVRTNGLVSSSSLERKKQLEELYENEEVKLIFIAAGGDYLYDMLEFVDFSKIKENVKWICGSSDPSSLLFIITTNLDIATIYTPANVGGFGYKKLHESLNNYFKIIKGEKTKQIKYDKYEEEEKGNNYNLDTNNNWIRNKDINETGILIGGCIECLKDIIGTKFDKTKEFIEKYKDKGIIWYFDVFNMSDTVLYNTLLQFKYAGWFKYTKCILIGKVKYKNIINEEYDVMLKRVLKDIPYIYQFDIGHVKPSFTLINGSYVKIVSNEKENYIEYL